MSAVSGDMYAAIKLEMIYWWISKCMTCDDMLFFFYDVLFFPQADGSIDYKDLFECLAGYGLGGSSIAMFGRVGGGIFTKAAG